MAGAKETPRQKMIGLMYLVLLAMLALQVSSAVILKFEQFNRELEESNKEIVSSNKHKLAILHSEIEKRQDAGSFKKMENKADNIRTRTEDVVSFIEGLKKMLIDKTGGIDQNGDLKGAKEETVVEELMIGPSKNGKAYALKETLNNYVKWMNQQGLAQHKKLALDAKDHPLFKNKKEQRMKDFAELNFGQSPMVASLATLSELERDVLNMERISLDAVADSLNMQDFKVKSLIPIVKTNSNYVVAGQDYNAELFLTAQLATEKPTMFLGEKNLDVSEAGIGKVTFKANANDYGSNGIAKKTWSGKINVKQPNGKDTTYEVSQEYYVARPTLLVQAGSVPNLYKNCGNELSVTVPELGSEYNPEYHVTGGRLIRGSQRNKITIVAEQPSVRLTVHSDGVKMGEQDFKVQLIPKPTIEAKVRGRSISPLTGITSSQLRSLNLDVIPDASFKAFLPREARYKVTKWSATLASGRMAKATDTGSGETLNFTRDFLTNAQPGQQLIIKIEELKRMNFRGETEEVHLSEAARYIKISVN